MNSCFLAQCICLFLLKITSYPSSLSSANACYKDLSGQVFLAVKYRGEHFYHSDYLRVEITVIPIDLEDVSFSELQVETYDLFYYSNKCDKTLEISQRNIRVASDTFKISVGIMKTEPYIADFLFGVNLIKEKATHEISDVYKRFNIFVDFVPNLTQIIPTGKGINDIQFDYQNVQEKVRYCIYTFTQERMFFLQFMKIKNMMNKTSQSVFVNLKLFKNDKDLINQKVSREEKWTGLLFECKNKPWKYSDSPLTFVFQENMKNFFIKFTVADILLREEATSVFEVNHKKIQFVRKFSDIEILNIKATQFRFQNFMSNQFLVPVLPYQAIESICTIDGSEMSVIQMIYHEYTLKRFIHKNKEYQDPNLMTICEEEDESLIDMCLGNSTEKHDVVKLLTDFYLQKDSDETA